MPVPAALSPSFPVVRDRDAVPERLAGAWVAIGNFDGVHRGHRAAIELAAVRAREAGGPALVLTFEPHPRSFFLPNEPTFRLSPEPVKLRLLADTGIDGVVIMTFDGGLAGRTAEDFIERTLVGRLALRGVVVGDNFRFGKARGGDPDLLLTAGERLGFRAAILDRVTWGGEPVSSGAVRAALKAGDIARANGFLGHRWFVEGEVIPGAARGRELGFPTANVVFDPGCELLHGVYAVRAHVEGRAYDAVTSFGRRPQFDNGGPVLETMLFDFAGDLYGKTLTVEFIGFIRPEQKFESVEALKARMDVDCAEARALLAGDNAAAGKT